MNFKLLEFDTKLFGFSVAKILPTHLSLAELQNTINELQKQNVRLVYWPSDSIDEISQQAAKKLNGFLSSEQITYLIDLKKISPPPLVAPEIKTYQGKNANTELEQLALQAGTYSRFNLDPNLPQELFIKLYHEWIENSVNGSIADRVIVAQHNNEIIGMVTLGEKNDRGDIGLLAVNSNFRGKKIGTKLVHAAQAHFIERGFSHAQVVTQKANIPASLLYEKCGFHQEKIENFYHFWI
jgi:dTDP-4-amino-4,6-dideoxy-D-galactose acyltransferase